MSCPNVSRASTRTVTLPAAPFSISQQLRAHSLPPKKYTNCRVNKTNQSTTKYYLLVCVYVSLLAVGLSDCLLVCLFACFHVCSFACWLLCLFAYLLFCFFAFLLVSLFSSLRFGFLALLRFTCLPVFLYFCKCNFFLYFLLLCPFYGN